MRKLLALLLTLVATPGLAEEGPELLMTEVRGTPAEIFERLDALLPVDVTRGSYGGVDTFTFEGDDAPDVLLAYLVSSFPDLDGRALSASEEVSLSLAIAQGPTGTTLHLMIEADTPVRVSAPSAPVPAGAEVIMEDGNPAHCVGQRILSQAAPAAESAEIHLGALRADGFEMADPPPGETSFFVGQRPGCAVFLYVEEDADDMNRSTVILRYASE